MYKNGQYKAKWNLNEALMNYSELWPHQAEGSYMFTCFPCAWVLKKKNMFEVN